MEKFPFLEKQIGMSGQRKLNTVKRQNGKLLNRPALSLTSDIVQSYTAAATLACRFVNVRHD